MPAAQSRSTRYFSRTDTKPPYFDQNRVLLRLLGQPSCRAGFARGPDRTDSRLIDIPSESSEGGTHADEVERRRAQASGFEIIRNGKRGAGAYKAEPVLAGLAGHLDTARQWPATRLLLRERPAAEWRRSRHGKSGDAVFLHLGRATLAEPTHDQHCVLRLRKSIRRQRFRPHPARAADWLYPRM